MLSAGKLGRGQERYYLEKVAEGAEDYYSGEGEAPGQWLGDGAEDLGLSGQVEPDQLVAMLTGRHPATGEPLGLRHVDGGAVPGFDLTFSAPKSVSLSWALGGPPVGAQVSEAHAEAVKAGLDYLQQTACLTRRGAGGHQFVHGNGFLAAGYTHRSSRAGDPQLHTHVLIANATKGPDGRWTRLYHPGIYHQLKTAGYVYEAHLRAELTQRLGVQWGEVKNGIAEIEGFDPEHLKAFSTRRAEILEAAGGEGASARAMQIATLATREAKDTDLATESLRELWRSKAQEIGLSREAIHSTFDPERAAVPDSRVAVAEIEATLTAHASHFDRRDAIQAVAENLPAGAPGAEVVELADAYLAHPGVISISSTPKGERFTTREIWELEQKALKGEARSWAADVKRGVDHGTLRAPTKRTLDEAAAAWLAGAETGRIRNRSGNHYKPSTLRGYRQALEDHVLPALGSRRVNAVTTYDLQALVDRWSGEDQSPSTIRNSIKPLQAIYRRARAREGLAMNPTRDLELPAPSPKEVEIVAPEVAAQLLDVLPVEDRALWATALYAGLRYGELRALRWSAVDLAGGAIRVTESWDPKEGAIAPKTKNSQRTTPLPGLLRDYLMVHRIAAGEPPVDTLVFGDKSGKPFQAATIYRRADRAWKARALGRLRLHQARHTYASFMIAAGVNAKALSSFMGHSSIKVTFDLYGHLMPGTEAEAAALLDKYLTLEGQEKGRIAAPA